MFIWPPPRANARQRRHRRPPSLPPKPILPSLPFPPRSKFGNGRFQTSEEKAKILGRLKA